MATKKPPPTAQPEVPPRAPPKHRGPAPPPAPPHELRPNRRPPRTRALQGGADLPLQLLQRPQPLVRHPEPRHASRVRRRRRHFRRRSGHFRSPPPMAARRFVHVTGSARLEALWEELGGRAASPPLPLYEISVVSGPPRLSGVTKPPKSPQIHPETARDRPKIRPGSLTRVHSSQRRPRALDPRRTQLRGGREENSRVGFGRPFTPFYGASPQATSPHSLSQTPPEDPAPYFLF